MSGVAILLALASTVRPTSLTAVVDLIVAKGKESGDGKGKIAKPHPP